MAVGVDYKLCCEHLVCLSWNGCESLPWSPYIISHPHHNSRMWLASHFMDKEAKTHKAHETCLGSHSVHVVGPGLKSRYSA